MKYKRLLISLCVIVAFAFATLVFVALFSVKDIEVGYSVYGERVTGAEEVLSVFKGKNLLFVSEEEIEKQLKDNLNLKIDEVKKVYPSTISVKLSGRQEMYAVSAEGGEYFVVDEEFAVVGKSKSVSNSVDLLDNVTVNFNAASFPEISVGKPLDKSDPLILAFIKTMSAFDRPRDKISVVEVYETAEKNNVRVNVQMRTGVHIVIFKALEKTDEKAQCAISKLRELSDGDKTIGRIECLELADGSISAVYTTH